MRLTAILVAIIIGAPACWWCPMAAAAEKTHHSCCCEDKEDASKTPADNSSGGKRCPCEMGQAPRDCAVDVQFVPVVNTGVDHFLPPSSFELLTWAETFHGRDVVYNDTGPPHVPRPHFQRHHTWLL